MVLLGIYPKEMKTCHTHTQKKKKNLCVSVYGSFINNQSLETTGYPVNGWCKLLLNKVWYIHTKEGRRVCYKKGNRKGSLWWWKCFVSMSISWLWYHTWSDRTMVLLAGEFLPETNSAWLWLRTLNSRSVRTQISVFKPPCVWYFVMVAQAKTDTKGNKDVLKR
jgi:hypothetical protein